MGSYLASDSVSDLPAALHTYLNFREVSIYGGPNEIQRNIIAKNRFGPVMALSEEHRLLQDLLSQILSQSTDEAQIWPAFAKDGLLGLNLSEASVGAELGGAELALIAAELGRHSVNLPWLGCEALAVPSLAEIAWAHRLMAEIAQGQVKLALAHLDQHARSTAARCQNGWILNGAKTLLRSGDLAEQFLITARFEDALAIIFVPRETPGLTISPYVRTVLGPAASVSFVNAMLPTESWLRRGEVASRALRQMQNRARLVVSAEMAGEIEELLDLTNSYLKTRQQFGVPIANFQALQHAATEIFAEKEVAVSMVQYGKLMLNAETEAADLALTSAKQRVSAAARIASELAVQLHGGIGMKQEAKVGRIFARLAVLRIVFVSEAECPFGF